MKKTPKRKIVKKKPRSNRKLPHLGVAAICESVMREQDGVVSMIRMIDTFNVKGDAKTLPPGVVSFVIYVAFKSGDALGERTLELASYSPSGKKVKTEKQKVKFKGDEQGVGAIFRVTMTINETGIYWFHVKLNRQDVTRIPLRINYKRVQKG